MAEVFLGRSPLERENQASTHTDVRHEPSQWWKIAIEGKGRRARMSLFSRAMFHGCDRERTGCTALREQRFQRGHPDLQGDVAISVFLFVDLEAAVVVINVVFIRPIQPVLLAEISRDAKSETDIALALKRK